MVSKNKTVKCANCGFLCGERMGGILSELNDEIRLTGNLSHKGFAIVVPKCYHKVIDIHEELDKATGIDRKNKISHVIGQERECSEFTEYIRGYSPKEHREMKLSDQRRMYEDKLRTKNMIIAIVAIISPVLLFLIRWAITGNP